MSFRAHIFTGIAATVLATGCGNLALQLVAGSGTGVQGLNPSADGSSFSERCGARASELSDPGYKLIDQKMRSIPIVVTTARSGINVKVTLQADVHISASSGESIQDTIVSLVKLESDDNGRFSKAEAEKAAAENSERNTSWGMSSGLLLKLQKIDPNFKNILCSVGFTAKQKKETINGTGLVIFEPGLPTAVNPRASMQTYDSELGASRSFAAVATIKQQGKDWAPVGTQATITVTFKKISPDPKSVAGMPAGAPAVDADVAFEALTTASGGQDVALFGLSKRQVFFINTKNRQLVGAMDDSGKLNPVDKKAMPANFAYLVE